MRVMPRVLCVLATSAGLAAQSLSNGREFRSAMTNVAIGGSCGSLFAFSAESEHTARARMRWLTLFEMPDTVEADLPFEDVGAICPVNATDRIITGVTGDGAGIACLVRLDVATSSIAILQTEDWGAMDPTVVLWHGELGTLAVFDGNAQTLLLAPFSGASLPTASHLLRIATAAEVPALAGCDVRMRAVQDGVGILPMRMAGDTSLTLADGAWRRLAESTSGPALARHGEPFAARSSLQIGRCVVDTKDLYVGSPRVRVACPLHRAEEGAVAARAGSVHAYLGIAFADPDAAAPVAAIGSTALLDAVAVLEFPQRALSWPIDGITTELAIPADPELEGTIVLLQWFAPSVANPADIVASDVFAASIGGGPDITSTKRPVLAAAGVAAARSRSPLVSARGGQPSRRSGGTVCDLHCSIRRPGPGEAQVAGARRIQSSLPARTPPPKMLGLAAA